AGYLAGGGDGIEAGGVHEYEAGGVDGFGVKEDVVEIGGAGFGDGAEGLLEDGGEAAGLVAGLRVVVDGAFVAGGVLLPPVDAVDEALGDFRTGGAASEEVFRAVDFGGFGEDCGAAVADENVDCRAEGGGGSAVFGQAAHGAVSDRGHGVDVRVGAEDCGVEVGADAGAGGGGAVDVGDDADAVARRDAPVGADDALERGGVVEELG